MKIQKPLTSSNVQESQSSQQNSKSSTASPRGISSNRDSVEMAGETSGKQQLTTDQEKMAGRIDAQDAESIGRQKGEKPDLQFPNSQQNQNSRALEYQLSKGKLRDAMQDRYKPGSSGSETRISFGRDGFELNNSGPAGRSDTLNKLRERFDPMNLVSQNQGGNLASHGKSLVSNQDPFFGALDGYNPGGPGATSDPHKHHGTPELFNQGSPRSYFDWVFDPDRKPEDDPRKDATYVMPDGTVVPASELTQDQKVAAEANKGKKTGDQETNTTVVKQDGQKPDKDWWERIKGVFTSSGATSTGTTDSSSGQPQPSAKDPGGYTGDPYRGPKGNNPLPDGEQFLPEALRTRNILQGGTGKGPGGGETVNPSPDDTSGSNVVIEGIYLSPGITKSTDLISQPERGQETGGGSGDTTLGPKQAGGAVDPLEGSAWTGGTRTEEPGETQTAPTGDLSHLLNNDDDDNDSKR